MQLSEILGFGPILTPLVGGVAAFFAIRQYAMQNTQKRAEMFFKSRAEVDKDFPDILSLLDDDDTEKAATALKAISFERREAFVAFHEEIALALRSKLVKPEVALYIFGHYAIKCWNNDAFWEDLERGKWFWKLFKEFVEEMKVLREKAETHWPEVSKELRFDGGAWNLCKH